MRVELRRWAHTLGLTLRGQAYSSSGPSPLDILDLFGRQDIAEGEDHSFESRFDLNFLQTLGTDIWRGMSTAVEMAGKKIVSTECCAERPALGYPRQTLLSHMNHQFAAGVNQIVYHGWSHKAPKLATSWPGWGGFNYGVSDEYGPFNPTWGSGDDKRINEYVGRVQTVMRRGRQRGDVAIYHAGKGHSVAGNRGERWIADLAMEHAGYRYGFMNKTMIASDPATVRDGRLDPDGEQFKAFVVDNTPNINKYTGIMELASAQRIARWADAGLPIIFVGPPPSRTIGNRPEQDAQLTAIIDGLLAKPSVRQVATQAELPAVLRAAGVKPATDFTAPSTLISTRRESDDVQRHGQGAAGPVHARGGRRRHPPPLAPDPGPRQPGGDWHVQDLGRSGSRLDWRHRRLSGSRQRPQLSTPPVSNAVVTIGFRQHIGSGQALRTGTYGKTLTFSLSTTTP